MLECSDFMSVLSHLTSDAYASAASTLSPEPSPKPHDGVTLAAVVKYYESHS